MAWGKGKINSIYELDEINYLWEVAGMSDHGFKAIYPYCGMVYAMTPQGDVYRLRLHWDGQAVCEALSLGTGRWPDEIVADIAQKNRDLRRAEEDQASEDHEAYAEMEEE